MHILQRLYDAAHTFGTQIRLEPVTAPASWTGPVFTGDVELAALAASRADAGRPIGHLPRA
ncbi:hypothetical protein ACH492_28330 [Streptomyces sp. NPDC019443]|uniref:hypothetical protein n=1 Tax=Streptomyces sp. NPDC019443 TaxID=3365061 RepID=UPI00379EDB38